MREDDIEAIGHIIWLVMYNTALVTFWSVVYIHGLGIKPKNN